MKLHELRQLTHKKTRVGRGIAAGKGKTAGRGTKGQKARTGRGAPVGFEGGQTRLYRRLPKVGGFHSHRVQTATVTLSQLSANFTDGARIDQAALVRTGLVHRSTPGRIVATGTLTLKGLRLAADVTATTAALKLLTASK